MDKYIVIFDGDCGFCQNTVNVLKKLDWLKRFDFHPFQNEKILNQYPFLTKEMCEKEIYLVSKNDKYYGGYDAFKIMSVYLPVTFLFSWFFFLPGVVQVGRWVYKLIAKNRHRFNSGKVCNK